jgi:carboxyl-terminal processing protease
MNESTKGVFGGLGIEVSMDQTGLVRVITPIVDTPAYRAGVEAGDLITHLDGEQVFGMTLDEAVAKMKGRINTDITLTIVRARVEEPLSITIKRDTIKVDPVRSRTEGNVGYVWITTFNAQTDVGLKKAMASLKSELGEAIEGIILDLRGNGGGLLDQAIAISDAFINQGEIVSTRGRHAEDANRYNAREGDIADGLPMIVLINGNSASASEIVAGALQDHGRAIIMGTKSFGKASVQTIMPLAGRGAIKLTTSRYYTPSGRSIQATGIVPDIIVEQARIEPVESGPLRNEASLRNHLEGEGEEQSGAGTTEPKPEGGAEAAEAEPERPEDYQLARALDLLRGITLFGGRLAN